jgi:aspartyl-tRNA(Asn)/glutamyl-tRNA(Gln) amidotransferase subunit C
MSIDRQTARQAAHLARIRVAEDDLDALAAELSGILTWIEQLREVDVEGVEPMSAVNPIPLRLRADTVTDGGIRDRVLANAPDAREGFFTVPKVVE